MALINIIVHQITTVQYLPVELFGSEMWDLAVQSSRRLDAFDQWCLRHILQVQFSAHVTNREIRRRSAQPPLTLTIKTKQLKLFGYIVCSDQDEEHVRGLNAGIDEPPKEWKQFGSHPRQTWL